MIDAAACGLPVVVNHTVKARERFEGNGLTYELGNDQDLVNVLRGLASADVRRKLGDAGAAKMREHFGWRAIAERRLRDYDRAVARPECRP